MMNNSWRERLPPFVMTLRIIVASLSAGVLIFMVIAVAQRLVPGGDGLNADVGILTIVTIAMTAATLVARAILPGAMVAGARRRMASGRGGPDAADQLLAVYQTSTIIACALCEGPAFLALITVLLDGSLIALAIAVALALLIALQMPSQQRVANWIERQQRLMMEESALRR